MPNYHYRCRCGNEESRIVPMQFRNSQECGCGKKLDIVIGAPSLHGFDKLGRSTKKRK